MVTSLFSSVSVHELNEVKIRDTLFTPEHAHTCFIHFHLFHEAFYVSLLCERKQAAWYLLQSFMQVILDSQANSFVSCHLSLTTGSKKNGRLYRGLFFFNLKVWTQS